MFSCKFCDNFKYNFFTEDLRWLLLVLLCASYTWNCNLFHSSGERTTLTYQIFWYKLYKIGCICLLFAFMFTFSIKFLQTSLMIKELIKHKNKFNRKVFHDRENSENRFSEFWYFMKYFKKYIMNISRQFTRWNYREIRIWWNALKEIFYSVSLP